MTPYFLSLFMYKLSPHGLPSSGGRRLKIYLFQIFLKGLFWESKILSYAFAQGFILLVGVLTVIASF